jgi:aspartate/methionine/tyrosine aminotransferase
MKYRLTQFANHLDGQPMFKVLAKVQEMQRAGKDIVHFEIGDPDFDTPENIVTAAVRALRAGKTHYAASIGTKEFREAIRKTTERSRGFLPDIDQVLVVPGANIGIYYAVRCLVEAGDEVIVPDPGFPTYYSVLKACDVTSVRVPLREANAFRMNPDDVRAAITPKTRMIIINSPQNPTGSVMTASEIEAIAQIAQEHDVYLYSDEIYARMYFAKGISFTSPSFLDHCKERTIVANGFSKAFAMTGWRIGALVGPLDVISKMELLLQTTSSCVPPFIQYAALEAIEGDQGAVTMMVEEYKSRMRILVDGLNNISGISCLEPGGAIYIFPNISGTGMTSAEFSNFALEKAGVAVLPGTNFGEYGEGYIRMCVVNSRVDIEKGVQRLKTAIQER